MKKSLRMKFMLLLFALVVGIGNVWADEYELYSGTITEGDYIIVYDGSAMKNTVTSNRLDYSSVTISSNKITNPSATIVWHIAASGDYWTIYNANVSKYAASTGAKNKAQLLDSGTDDMSLWSVSGTSSYEFVNKKNAANNVNKNLRKNGTYGFACYGTDTGDALSLYKKVEATGAATTVIINSSGITNTNKFFGTEAGTLNATVTVTATSANVDGATVTWSSSDEDVATVGEDDGEVTLVGEGSTTITASYAGETGEYKSSYAEYVLNVTDESPFNYTLWSEDFSGYEAGNVPSGGTYSYVCVDGGSKTQIYEANMAGGTSPELLVNKSGGYFQATIPLDNITGNLKLKFKSNAYAVTISTSTEGISISGASSFNAAGEHIVTFTGIIPSKTSIVIKFAAGSNNVRIDDIELTGAIPGDNNHELTEDFTIPTGTTFDITSEFIIPDGITLTVNGTLENDDPANLIIEDGGQIILPKDASVQATVKRSITGGSKGAAVWEAFASTINNPAIGNTNLITGLSAYDLYMYDESKTGAEWRNYKTHTGDFANLTNSRGYIYRNAENMDITITGALNTSDISAYTLSRAGSGDYIGFNLIGNPYQMEIYKGVAISNTYLNAGYYILDNEGAWRVKADDVAIEEGAGIMVQVQEGGHNKALEVTYTGASSKADGDNIMFTVSNSQYEDAAYALFEDVKGLNKIEHRNPAIQKLYINQNGENFAIATMSNEAQSFNLNFKAMTIGKYTLKYKTNANISYLHIIDRLTGEDVDMLLEGEYSFIGAPSDSDNRFIVRLAYASGNDNNNDIFAYQSGNDIVVNGEGELQIFDITGRMVQNMNVNGVETISVQSQGVYIFRLIGNEIQTQKIIVR